MELRMAVITDQTARNQYAARVLLGVALLGAGIYTLSGFLHALAWAGILAIATWPLFERAERRFGTSQALLPLLFTFGAVLIVIVPLGLAAVQVGHETRAAIHFVTAARVNGVAAPDWLSTLPLFASQATGWWNANLAHPEDARHLLGSIDRGALVGLSRGLGGAVVHEAVTFAFTLVTLFFLFKSGHSLAAKALTATEQLFGSGGVRVARQMIASIHGTVDGMVLVGLGVGALLGVGYWIVGAPHPVLLGALTAIAALIPMGAPIVLGIASVIVLAQGHTLSAALLFGVGMVIVFIADHAVRPALIGGATKLPFLWVLLGILGGVETFGLLGLFLGPAIMAALILLWREWTGDATQPLPLLTNNP